jgi:hypothetical protein
MPEISIRLSLFAAHLHAAKSEIFVAVTADRQEPPELLIAFLEKLVSHDCDVAIGVHDGRDDPPFSRISANTFWGFYGRLVIKDIPEGGVDLFGCNASVRSELLRLKRLIRRLSASCSGSIFARASSNTDVVPELRQERVDLYRCPRFVSNCNKPCHSSGPTAQLSGEPDRTRQLFLASRACLLA